MIEIPTHETIRIYWDERARERLNNLTATTDDVFLRKLEIKTFVDILHSLSLPENANILDLGCGDGYSTLEIASRYPLATFWGVDYSANMIELAQNHLETQPELKNRIFFAQADVLKLWEFSPKQQFDVILTDRCLINLDSLKSQLFALEEISKRLKPGGYYIGIENFMEGQAQLNIARSQMGLPEIPVRWHNCYFHESEIVAETSRFFDNIEFQDFSSSYYFATRVLYSALCHEKGIEPDYNHEIHQLAVNLPSIGQFSPIRLMKMSKPIK